MGVRDEEDVGLLPIEAELCDVRLVCYVMTRVHSQLPWKRGLCEMRDESVAR